MPELIATLEQHRAIILQAIVALPDLRSGSITATSGTCGKPNCHCHRPNQPKHGPHFRLTRKVDSQTVTETFATPAELCKAQREVEAYHRFRELSQQLLEVNEKICRARPVEEDSLAQQKKKRPRRSSRKSGEK